MDLKDFNVYQEQAGGTAKYAGKGELEGLIYCVLGAAGEAGELANKMKKVLRDDNGVLTPKAKTAMTDELGDVLWYLSQIARELGVEFSLVPALNLLKLYDRRDRGVIGGSGDNR